MHSFLQTEGLRFRRPFLFSMREDLLSVFLSFHGGGPAPCTRIRANGGIPAGRRSSHTRRKTPKNHILLRTRSHIQATSPRRHKAYPRISSSSQLCAAVLRSNALYICNYSLPVSFYIFRCSTHYSPTNIPRYMPAPVNNWQALRE